MKGCYALIIVLSFIFASYCVFSENRVNDLQQRMETVNGDVFEKNESQEKDIRLLKTDVQKLEEVVYGGDYE